jgi:hypothetical protein
VGSWKNRTLADCLDYLHPLHADVVVLSEGPIAPPSDVWSWTAPAGRPRLCVWATPPYSVHSLLVSGAAPSQSGLFSVSGPVSFTLSATWPVQQPRGPRYSRLLAETFEQHAEAFGQGPAIMAGDFNSSPVISGQEGTHPAFVARAEVVGLVSAFHFQEGVAHGAEAAGTLRRGKKVRKQYHIDYCFVSKFMAPAASLSIIKNEKWSARGDHWPPILDIPNAAFGETAPSPRFAADEGRFSR